ncbi:MAG: DUF364 domain-containing protein [Deltaproteobacteria bacterium]|nr:DUF364 domain-containing protein [Deltaproteobacteria bacterium]
MKLIEDIIESLKGKDVKIKNVYVGVFWTIVESLHGGLASTLVDKSHEHHHIADAGHLTEKNANELIKKALSSSLLDSSIGLATINSLLDVDEKWITEINAADILFEKAKDKNCAIIGHFPFINKLEKEAKNLWTIEMYPREKDLTVEEGWEVLPLAEVVGITGTTLINKTLDGIISSCPNAFKVMIGPTTPLTPILFDYGLDVISGSIVISTEKILPYIQEGASFRQIHPHGVKLVTMTKEKI